MIQHRCGVKGWRFAGVLFRDRPCPACWRDRIVAMLARPRRLMRDGLGNFFFARSKGYSLADSARVAWQFSEGTKRNRPVRPLIAGLYRLSGAKGEGVGRYCAADVNRVGPEDIRQLGIGAMFEGVPCQPPWEVGP